MMPKLVGASNLAFGKAKLGWLAKLKNSARNSIRRLSLQRSLLTNDKSTFFIVGPRAMFRPAFPNVPAAGIANAALLIQWSGPWPAGTRLTLATRFGRSTEPGVVRER